MSFFFRVMPEKACMVGVLRTLSHIHRYYGACWHISKCHKCPKYVFSINGVAIRATDAPIPNFCMKIRSGSNGIPPGPETTQKIKVLNNGSPTIKITNEAPTKVFHLSRASQVPYSEKNNYYSLYNYVFFFCYPSLPSMGGSILISHIWFP